MFQVNKKGTRPDTIEDSLGISLCEIVPLHFVYQIRTVRSFSTKFRNSDSNFDRNILTPLYLKFEAYSQDQIQITRYYIVFTNSLA